MNDLPALARLEAPASITAATLDARRDAGQPFPIIEPGRCTFAYHGPVQEVTLSHFGVGLPADLAFTRIGDSPWRVLTLSVPEGTRLEYKLTVTDSFGQRLIEDPLNPRLASHPFGANSVLLAHGYEAPPWSLPRPDVERGRTIEFYLDSEALGRKVTAHVYLPANFTGEPATPYSLLVAHDGDDYLTYADTATTLDNLIDDGAMPPTIAVFVNPDERLVEYADDARHTAMLVDELLPELTQDLPVTSDPARRCLMGASFGAVATFAAALRRPGVFGRLCSQSGSFAGAGRASGAVCLERPEPLWDPVKRFVDELLAAREPIAERVYVTCGAYESLICENRALVPVLRSTGADVRFVQHAGGHNWDCWRDVLGSGLPWLLDGSDR